MNLKINKIGATFNRMSHPIRKIAD